jgi:hypothetical protein
MTADRSASRAAASPHSSWAGRPGIRAIDTRYAGHRFRSRLEARWAVFFDALGITWQYEPQGYELSDGTLYLPDFFLPGFHNRERGIWVEVKPEDGHFGKAWRFSKEIGTDMLLAAGLPSTGIFYLVAGREVAQDGSDLDDPDAVNFYGRYLPGGSHAKEYRLFIQSEVDMGCPTVQRAAARAASARFEFGEGA